MKQKELTLLFLRRNGQILLAMKKRGFGEGRWNGVGGKVEDGETLEQALIRECQEEISVTPKSYDKVAEVIFNELHEGERKIMRVHTYTCTEWVGEPTESDEMRPEWFAEDAIPYEQCWSDDPYWLPQVLAGKKVVAHFTMDENDQVSHHQVEEVASL